MVGAIAIKDRIDGEVFHPDGAIAIRGLQPFECVFIASQRCVDGSLFVSCGPVIVRCCPRMASSVGTTSVRGYFAQDDGVGWSCAIPGLKGETLRLRSGLALGHPCSRFGLLGRADLWSASHELVRAGPSTPLRFAQDDGVGGSG